MTQNADHLVALTELHITHTVTHVSGLEPQALAQLQSVIQSCTAAFSVGSSLFRSSFYTVDLYTALNGFDNFILHIHNLFIKLIVTHFVKPPGFLLLFEILTPPIGKVKVVCRDVF